MGQRKPDYQSDHNLTLRKEQSIRPDLYRYQMYSDGMQVDANESLSSQDLLDYGHILWLNKFRILRFCLLGLLLALSYSFFQTPVYRARTSIAIQDLNENFLNLKEDPTAINPTGPAESYFQTQVQILQSETLLQRVMDKPTIARALEEEKARSRIMTWRDDLGFADPASSHDLRPTVEKVASRLTVRSFGETRLVQVYFESSDPKLAADFANTLVNEFIEQTHQMRWESTQRTADWLSAHLSEMKTSLENGEAQLQSYARDTGLLFSEKGNVAEDRLRQLQQEYSKAQVDRAEKQAKYETALTSLPEVLDDPAIRELGLKLAELSETKAQLTSELTPEHYKVRQVQAQIDELTSTLERQRKNMIRREANDYLSARRHEELLAGAYERQARTVSQQAQKTIHYDTLKHEVDSSRQLYDALVQRVKQAGLAAAMRGSNILVVDEAKAPVLPYRPNFLLNSAIGLLTGMFCGVGFSILRERFSRCIVAPGVAPTYLKLPELGAIPMVAIPASRFSRLLSSEDNSLSMVPRPTQEARIDTKIVKMNLGEREVDRADLLMLAEAFRATLTSILLPEFEGSSPGVIVITSPEPGAGKTTLACNLGIAMAQIGRRVLLVDADLARPNLHHSFKLSNDWGLCDLLRSNDPIDEQVVAQIVRRTDVEGLDLLSVGTQGGNPSRLLYSLRVAELLQRVRQDYNLVLIDTPPMMLVADARVLGRVADGVVLIIRAEQTTLEHAQLAVQRFAEDGTRVLGTVLNSWNPKTGARTDYAYGYKYQ
jgi:polysaccharide biosynthesis transport protein